MSLFSKLFGGGSTPKTAPETAQETYEGFRIFPEPAKEPGGFRIAARIEKEVKGEVKIHHMIRADICSSQEEAVAFSVTKAKLLIDEQGDRIFR